MIMAKLVMLMMNFMMMLMMMLMMTSESVTHGFAGRCGDGYNRGRRKTTAIGTLHCSRYSAASVPT